MQKLVFINGAGKQIDLTSGNFGITNWEGLSNTGLNIQTQQVPFQDGGVFLDALMEEREIELTVAIQDNNNLELRYQKKRELISALNPKVGEGTLIYTNDYLSRQIKAVPQIPIFENKNSNDAGTLKASVVFSCPSPYWEDVEENVVVFNNTKQPIINNEGDVPTQIRIDFLTTNVKNPTITRLEDNKKIKYSGELYDNLLIDTNTGNKSAILEKIEFFTQHIGGPINDILYEENRNLLFIVSDKGLIYVSKEFEDWQIAQRVINADLFSIIYCDELGLFIAVGGDDFTTGSIITSTDGFHWVKRKDDRNYKDVIYVKEKGLFVAVGNGAHFATSEDGIEWTDSMIPVGGSIESLKQIYYSAEKDLYIVVGYFQNSQGYIFTSSDLENWTTKFAGNPVYSVAYSKTLDLFIIVGRETLFTSSNGVDWDSVLGAGSGTNVIYSQEYKIFIKLYLGNIYTSINGTDWTLRFNTNNTFNTITPYIDLLGIFVVGGEKGVIAYSYDGLDWTYKIDSSTGISSNININSVAYSKTLDLYVLVGTNGVIYTSKDLLVLKNVNYNINYILNSVVYSEEKELFVAVGVNKILTSPDGENWTSQNIASSNEIIFNTVIYCEEYKLFIAGGYFSSNYNMALRYSNDGITWEVQTGSLANTIIRKIVYSNILKIFVAIGGNSEGDVCKILKGEMTQYGMSWTTINVADVKALTDVIYSENLKLFIAIGSYNNSQAQVLISENGVNWNVINTGINIYFRKCFYSERMGILFLSAYDSSLYPTISYPLYKSYDGSTFSKIQDYFVSINQFIEVADSIYGVGEVTAIIKDTLKLGDNVIQNISSDSDMGLNLEIGENQFRLNKDSGNFNCRITYRQKYIGV